MKKVINIVAHSAVVDNWGAMEHTEDPYMIANRLQSPQDWSDDELFADENGNQYFVEDLVGSIVKLVNGVQIAVEDAHDDELSAMLDDDFNDFYDANDDDDDE